MTLSETADGADGRRAVTRPWRLVRHATRRLGWGVADQAMSSISNFAVNIYIARTLGAVQYGAFGLAYVTYGFMLNASRGLATDPLLVRFSGTHPPTWRRAVASCTGTATVVGLVVGACALVAAWLLSGTTRQAFLALGLTLPGLLLQDCWRYSFFALGRGSQAFLNDTIWTVALLPALVLLKGKRPRGCVLVRLRLGRRGRWRPRSAHCRPGSVPRLPRTWEWLWRHRDLGPRYSRGGYRQRRSHRAAQLWPGSSSASRRLATLQAAGTLMGPFMVMFFGMGLVTLPEAARILRRSPRHCRCSACWSAPGWPSPGSPGESSCWWRCRGDSGT